MEATWQVGLSSRRSICCRILAAPTADGATGLGGEASVLVDHAAEAWVADDWSLRRG
jgi:hypothetical protein